MFTQVSTGCHSGTRGIYYSSLLQSCVCISSVSTRDFLFYVCGEHWSDYWRTTKICPALCRPHQRLYSIWPMSRSTASSPDACSHVLLSSHGGHGPLPPWLEIRTFLLYSHLCWLSYRWYARHSSDDHLGIRSANGKTLARCRTGVSRRRSCSEPAFCRSCQFSAVNLDCRLLCLLGIRDNCFWVLSPRWYRGASTADSCLSSVLTLKYLCIYNHGDQRFQFGIIINALVIFSRFIWLPTLFVYGHYKLCYSFSAGIDFRRQNLTSRDA